MGFRRVEIHLNRFLKVTVGTDRRSALTQKYFPEFAQKLPFSVYGDRAYSWSKGSV